MSRVCLFFLLILSTIVYSVHFSHNAFAQQTEAQTVARLNDTTFAIVGGDIHSSSTRLIKDLAVLLNDGGKRRVLPVLGLDSASGVSDVLHLRGVDAAIVHEDSLDAIRQNDTFPNVGTRIQYIAKLSRANIYVVAKKSIANINDLAGKKVNFGPGGESPHTTPALLFKTLGIKAQPVNIHQERAIAKIKSGDIAATVIVGASLDDIAASFAGNNDVRILPIPWHPSSKYYVPVEIPGKKYPHLVPANGSLGTVAVSQVMIVNNWPKSHARHRKVTRFVQAFFDRIKDLSRDGYMQDWKHINFAARLPDWTRFSAAQSWIDTSSPAEPAALNAIRKFFDEMIIQRTESANNEATGKKRAQLYQQFLSWPQNPVEAKITMRLTSVNGVGKVIGTITAKNQEAEVAGRKEPGLSLTPKLEMLKPGRYVFDIHEKPNCGAAEKGGKLVPGFAAGDRLPLSGTGPPDRNPSGKPRGDLPVLQVGPNGAATQPVFAVGLTLADLVDRSMVIRADRNDASPRSVCGVVQ